MAKAAGGRRAAATKGTDCAIECWQRVRAQHAADQRVDDRELGDVAENGGHHRLHDAGEGHTALAALGERLNDAGADGVERGRENAGQRLDAGLSLGKLLRGDPGTIILSG